MVSSNGIEPLTSELSAPCSNRLSYDDAGNLRAVPTTLVWRCYDHFMANHRSYTDDNLRTAVAVGFCWADVMESLGKGRGANPRWPRERAIRMGLDTSHFNPSHHLSARRSYSDNELRQAVSASTSWAAVTEELGRGRDAASNPVRKVAERLGLDFSHFDTRSSGRPVIPQAVPFSRSPGNGLCSGLTLAARWFLDRGYMVSLPVEPAPYDLICESDSGLKRVQVKSTRRKQPNGRHSVRLARRVYDPVLPGNAAGRYRHVCYTSSEIDLFFILTSDGSSYLIPLSAVEGTMNLALDGKYAAYLV
jgi:hypothetical protein